MNCTNNDVINQEVSTIEALNTLTRSNESLTELDLAVAILGVFFNSSLTQTALENILNLMNIVTGKDLPKSFNQLSKFIMKTTDDEIKYEKIWYCDVCVKSFEKLDNRFKRNCPVCESRLSMYFHFSIFHQIQRIFGDIDIKDTSLSNELELIDISDGRIYKNILKQEKKGSDNIFTLSISTDGVSLCEKSNLGVWPIYGVFNEIATDQRFCPENVMILGEKIIFLKVLIIDY